MSYKPFISGDVDADNSSTTALNNSQVFTGDWTDVSEYASVIVAVSTDQNGTYSIQFSPDGTNQDSTLTRYYKTDEINVPHRFTVTRRYCRVVFTNDSGSNQTYFRLQTIKSHHAQPLNVPMDGVVAQDYDATVVRPTEWNTEVSLGLRQGAARWDMWGYNDDIDTAAAEMIWTPGGLLTPLTTARTMSIVSTSTSDTSAGTGARTLVVYGVDANRKYQVEQVTMNGTTPVVTVNSWLGINRIAVASAGSALANVGTITATATTDATTQAQIPATEGTSQQCIFFGQADHTILVKYLQFNALRLSGGSAPKLLFRMFSRSFVSGARYELFRYRMDTDKENFARIHLDSFPITEQSVVWLQASSDTNNTAVTGRIGLHEHRHVDD